MKERIAVNKGRLLLKIEDRSEGRREGLYLHTTFGRVHLHTHFMFAFPFSPED